MRTVGRRSDSFRRRVPQTGDQPEHPLLAHGDRRYTEPGALAAGKPKVRFRVGSQARYVLPLLRRFPVGPRDRMIMSGLGLDVARREAQRRALSPG